MTETFLSVWILVWTVTSIVAVLLEWEWLNKVAIILNKKLTIKQFFRWYTKRKIFLTLMWGANIITVIGSLVQLDDLQKVEKNEQG